MQDWKDQQVVILGLARQGKALASYLSQKGARVIVSDRKPAEDLQEERKALSNWPIEYVLGDHPQEILEGTSQLFVSGGVPLDIPIVMRAKELGIPVSNDSQLFLDRCPATVIGITGSAGKSTTTALVGRIADAHTIALGKNAWTGGNIGRPLLEDVEEMEPGDWAIMELSSFQLELMQPGLHIAALLNLAPNHLDRHKTMEAYTAAKAKVFLSQTEKDFAVINREDPAAWELRELVSGQLISFGFTDFEGAEGTYLREDCVYARMNGHETKLLECKQIMLKGEHNVANVLAACAIAVVANFSQEAIVRGVEGFSGLPHRLEFVREVDGVFWYNDSIATSPDRSIAAMKSFERPIVLLAGGRDKDLVWEEFAKWVIERVDHLVLFGEAAEKIGRAVDLFREQSPTLDYCSGLEPAVMKAAEIAHEGDVVLLAPGGTSFDEFIDFAARGERFRQLVEAL